MTPIRAIHHKHVMKGLLKDRACQPRHAAPLCGAVFELSEGAVHAAPEDTAEGEAASRRRASEGETGGFPSEVTPISPKNDITSMEDQSG